MGNQVDIKTQICTGPCGLEKELNRENFHFRNDSKKFRPECIACVNKLNKINYKKNKGPPQRAISEDILIYGTDLIIRICKGCDISKELNTNNFYVCNNKSGFRQDCKVCHAERDKTPEAKSKANARRRKKQKNNKTFAVREIIRGQIKVALKNRGGSKRGNSFTKYLDYTIEDLEKHLESQFESWMTWENHGSYRSGTWDDNDPKTWTWHLDHIRPQSDFNYISMEDEEFRECWGLANLRPYPAKQNIIDGSLRSRHKGKK